MIVLVIEMLGFKNWLLIVDVETRNWFKFSNLGLAMCLITIKIKVDILKPHMSCYNYNEKIKVEIFKPQKTHSLSCAKNKPRKCKEVV